MKNIQLSRSLINLIPSRIRNEILYIISGSDPYSSFNKTSRKIVVMLGADYGNLGDVAITESQIKYLKSIFPNHILVEVPISRTYRDMKSLKKSINPEDIITMVGGGNTGSLYPEIEAQRRFIVRCFPRNRIVAFPQSVYFSEDTKSQKILNQSAKCYSKHPDLTMFARDQYSFDFFTQDFAVKSRLLPDIVLSTPSLPQRKRNKTVVISIRADKESSLPESSRSKIASTFRYDGFKVIERDTDIKSTRLTNLGRNKELTRMLDLYLGAQLVVTDRLHGMIFCVITKTPCIVFENNNGKVLGAFNLWVKGTDYVRIVKASDVDSINDQARLLFENSKGRRRSLKNKFNELEEILKGNG